MLITQGKYKIFYPLFFEICPSKLIVYKSMFQLRIIISIIFSSFFLNINLFSQTINLNGSPGAISLGALSTCESTASSTRTFTINGTELTANIVPKLCQVAKTDGNVAMYISNGHGAWEAALSNTTNRGGRRARASTSL